MDDIRLEDLTTTKVIGRGSGGVVQAVIHKPTSRTMALKVLGFRGFFSLLATHCSVLNDS
jgi:hypothetical protein